MKPLKIIGIVAAGLIGLVVLAVLAVLLLVNPNEFKPRIVAAVKDSTGRDLNLQGDIKLSVFPWVALTLGPAKLGNPPGFGDSPFLSFTRADVRVKLLPLLGKRLEVAKVVLDGLDLRLVKKPDGQSNWQMQSSAPEAARSSALGSAGVPSLQSIGGIAVTHGRVSYNQYTLDNLDFETGTIAGNQQVPVSLTLAANRGVTGESVALSAKLQVQADPATKAIHVGSFELTGDVHRAAGAPLHYDLSAPQLDVNLDQQTLDLPAFSFGLGDAKVTGKLSGAHIIDDLHLNGAVSLGEVALRSFAANLGVTLPKTQDPNAFAAFSAGTGFSYDAAGIAFDDLQMKLDDTTLKGSLGVATGKEEAVTFKLAADRINVDRYRPPVSTARGARDAPAPAAQPEAASATPLRVEGTFALGAAHAAGLDFANLVVTVHMQDKVMHLHPLQAQLYGGRYSGDLTYDTHATVPGISMDEHLVGVDVAQLVANTKAKGRIVGRATVNIKATARGAGADDIMKSLNGHFDADLANGAISGLDVGYELAFAQALVNRQTSTTVPNTHKTSFDAFKTSAQITNGVAATHDLLISSAVLKVTGQGTVNLPTSGIDMTLLASLMKSAGHSAADIPLKVTGTYTDPAVKPDITALAKDQLKQRAQDLLKKHGLDLNRFLK
jgi:AsmA protein